MTATARKSPTKTTKRAKPLNVVWKPHPGPQTKFLASAVHEVLYGGQAGGGKSAALIVLPLRWANNPNFYAVTIRRDSPQLDDLLLKAWRVYPMVAPGADYYANPYPLWKFPAPGMARAGSRDGPGAIIRYGHCDTEKDAYKYQGKEIHCLNFDELTHFTEFQYLEIKTRVRTTFPGCPAIVRATTNPGGVGHDWVFRRWGPWLDPEFEGAGLKPRFSPEGRRLPPARPGEVLWILRTDEGREFYVPQGTPHAQSRTFIPAKASDNPSLLENDPEYLNRLRDHDPVRAKQLADGDWLAKPAPGEYFQRGWVEFVDAAPAGVRAVRYWDLAGTKKKPDKKNHDPDWTVGVRMSMKDGIFFIEDVVRFRGDPHTVEKNLRTTAELDGQRVRVGIEEDPGQAGKFQAAALIKVLNGFTVHKFSPSGNKLERFGPFSAQAKAGNVKVVRGPWNDAWVRELEQIPEGTHDDQQDGTSGAHMMLSRPVVIDLGVGSAASDRMWR